MPKKDDRVTAAYRQSKSIYDDVLTQSKWWSRLYVRFFWGVDDIQITEAIFAMLPKGFAGRLLDVPCRTLNLTAAKYEALPQARITCLDYSQDMLAGARARSAQHQLRNVTLLQGDVGALPFASETFDAVLSMNGFHVFPDKAKAYAQTARVLKPGGLFLGCFYVRGENKRSDFVVNAVLAKKGWFTPPFQTKEDVLATLRQHYTHMDLYGEKAMAWFCCTK